MAKSKIKMNTKPLPIESNNYMSVLDFVKLHDSFISQKLVEDLSQRTLQDYKKHMDYFKSGLGLSLKKIRHTLIIDEQLEVPVSSYHDRTFGEVLSCLNYDYKGHIP